MSQPALVYGVRYWRIVHTIMCGGLIFDDSNEELYDINFIQLKICKMSLILSNLTAKTFTDACAQKQRGIQ